MRDRSQETLSAEKIDARLSFLPARSLPACGPVLANEVSYDLRTTQRSCRANTR